MKLHSSDFVRFVQLKARGKKNHIPVWFDNNLKSLILQIKREDSNKRKIVGWKLEHHFGLTDFCQITVRQVTKKKCYLLWIVI